MLKIKKKCSFYKYLIDGINLQYCLKKSIPSKLQKYYEYRHIAWLLKLVDIVTQIEKLDFVHIAKLVLKMNFIFYLFVIYKEHCANYT